MINIIIGACNKTGVPVQYTRQYFADLVPIWCRLEVIVYIVSGIDVLNKDCRRSISAILTWVPENVKISARPLNSIGN